jgi:hypothetical protein
MIDKGKIANIGGANAMKLLLVSLFCVMSIDGIFTYWAVTSGLASEWNDKIAPIAGDWQFVFLKVLGAIVSALVLWTVYKHLPKIAFIGATCIVAFYVAVLAWNFSTLFFA